MAERISDKQEQIVLNAYAAGKNGAQAAALAGCGKGACYATLRRHGLSPRAPGESRRKYRLNHEFFAHVDTEEKAWLLGFLSADGSICGNVISIGLAGRDAEVLRQIRKLMGYSGPVRLYYGKDGPVARLDWSSPQMVEDLRQLGVTERKSHVIAPWEGPPELKAAFYRGVVDGDGSLCRVRESNGGTTYRVSLVGSAKMVSGFADLLGERIGYRPRVRPHKAIFETAVKGVELAQAVVRVLYEGASIYLARKKKTADQILRAKFRKCNRFPHTITAGGETGTLTEWSERQGLNRGTLTSRIKAGWSPEELLEPLRRDDHLLTFQGETKTVSQWARDLDLRISTLFGRLQRCGWNVEEALTCPIQAKRGPITFEGETHSLTEWARRRGLTEAALRLRLRRGWPLEKALNTPQQA